MRLSVAVDMDQLHLLPIEIRLDIQRALRIEPSPGYQPPTPAAAQQAPPEKMLPTHVYQPPASTGPPPRLDGKTLVFPPSMGSPMQQNSAMDVMTGQPISIPPVSQAPPIPQVSNAPINVGPVAVSGPPTVTQHPGVSAADVRAHAIRLFQDQARGGAGLVNAALSRSGLHQLAALNDGNAAALWQAIVELGGQ